MILVTGSTGFIGSHLVERLKEEEGIPFKEFKGDICEEKDVIRNLRDIDTVIHLAALTYVPPSFPNASSYFQVNTFGTLNFLKNCQMFKRFIYVSTSHTYGNALTHLKLNIITENTPQMPIDPYSVSKLAAEKLTMIYGETEGFDYAIIRPFNNYGPRHARTYVIPSMIIQALSKREIVVNGNAYRDFTYVTDTVDAFVRVIKAERLKHRVYNVTSERCCLISVVANEIWRLIYKDKPNVEVLDKLTRPLDIPVLHGSSARIREELGWVPQVDLVEGLKKTLDFWRENKP